MKLIDFYLALLIAIAWGFWLAYLIWGYK